MRIPMGLTAVVAATGVVGVLMLPAGDRPVSSVGPEAQATEVIGAMLEPRAVEATVTQPVPMTRDSDLRDATEVAALPNSATPQADTRVVDGSGEQPDWVAWATTPRENELAGTNAARTAWTWIKPGAVPPRTQPSLPGSGEVVQVASSAVNMRSGPSTGYGTVGVLRPGQEVRLIGMWGGWAQVATADGQGFVYSRYLNLSNEAAANAPQVQVAAIEPPAARVEAEDQPRQAVPRGQTIRMTRSVALRTDPSQGAQRFAVVGQGETVSVIGQRGRWLQVQARDGTTGWVQTR